MGKYAAIQSDVFSVFASSDWTSTNIKTFPSNYLADNSGSEFIRVTVLPTGTGVNRVSTSGLLMVEIYTKSGEGPSRSSQIADILDTRFQSKSFNTLGGVTQFKTSAFTQRGFDKDNLGLWRSEYQLPFNYFEVT